MADAVHRTEVWAVLGHRLDHERERRALTRTDLAASAAVSFGAVHRALGGNPVHMHILRRIVDALELDWSAVLAELAVTGRGRSTRRAPSPAAGS